MFRIVCISDLHCGHRTGLTPPSYQRLTKRLSNYTDNLGITYDKSHIWDKFYRIENECYSWYENKVKKHYAPDLLVINGDAIDGSSERSGGVELITSDRNEQIEMAIECIEIWGAQNIVMVRGTPYHVGDKESWEDIIDREINCKIGEHEWVERDGIVFDFKHYVGSSSVPYGRKTAVNRDQICNLIWAEAELQPLADWIIRSHVHYSEGGYKQIGAKEIWAITTPALQGMGTRYGARLCSGLIDFGFVGWDIDDGRVNFWKEILFVQSQKAQTLKF